jgi:hypothetical protein
MNQNYRTFKKNHNLTVGGAPCTESIQFSKCVSGNTAGLIKIS